MARYLFYGTDTRLPASFNNNRPYTIFLLKKSSYAKIVTVKFARFDRIHGHFAMQTRTATKCRRWTKTRAWHEQAIIMNTRLSRTRRIFESFFFRPRRVYRTIVAESLFFWFYDGTTINQSPIVPA